MPGEGEVVGNESIVGGFDGLLITDTMSGGALWPVYDGRQVVSHRKGRMGTWERKWV